MRFIPIRNIPEVVVIDRIENADFYKNAFGHEDKIAIQVIDLIQLAISWYKALGFIITSVYDLLGSLFLHQTGDYCLMAQKFTAFQHFIKAVVIKEQIVIKPEIEIVVLASGCFCPGFSHSSAPKQIAVSVNENDLREHFAYSISRSIG